MNRRHYDVVDGASAGYTEKVQSRLLDKKDDIFNKERGE